MPDRLVARALERGALTALPVLWLLALIVGIAAGYAAVGFRLGIAYFQTLFYGADDRTLATTIAGLDTVTVLAIPVLGGLAVGLLMRWLARDGRQRAVAQVIEGAALNGGRIEHREGLASALSSLITLSTGGSTGREGPVVHLAALIASWISTRLKTDAVTGRELMGCAAAAAVAASFNAPIAGAIFAHEVILRHFAVHALAPITIAAVSGAVVSRLHLGDLVEFELPVQGIGFYAELPAFLLLGLVGGLVGVALIRGILLAEDVGDRVQDRLRLPNWARPALTGVLLGLIALGFPHIIGVGYETTLRALHGEFVFAVAILYAGVKAVAVAITMAGRMGGGIFSPSLMIGALTGLAFGEAATGLLPWLSGDVTLYTLAGMGAVAAAVLGAPISTTLIVFELTGDWRTGIAVMLSISLASAVASHLVHGSFFLSQLVRSARNLVAGPADYLPSLIAVGPLMRPVSEAERDGLAGMAERGLHLGEGATLEVALPMFRRGEVSVLPVTRRQGEALEIVGALHEVDALRAYSEALARAAREEHS